MLKLLWSRPLGPDTDALKIAGIDMNLGLKQVGGKRERYESLLRKFARGKQEPLQPFVLRSRPEMPRTAEREAHSLKGAASHPWCASPGRSRIADVETLLKTGQGVEQALGSLSHSLVAVVKAIQSSLPD